MFFKIGLLKNFAIFTGKQLWRSLVLIKLQSCNFPANIVKFFHKTTLVAVSEKSINFPGKQISPLANQRNVLPLPLNCLINFYWVLNIFHPHCVFHFSCKTEERKKRTLFCFLILSCINEKRVQTKLPQKKFNKV